MIFDEVLLHENTCECCLWLFTIFPGQKQYFYSEIWEKMRYSVIFSILDHFMINVISLNLLWSNLYDTVTFMDTLYNFLPWFKS